jgi:hypothetical protein
MLRAITLTSGLWIWTLSATVPQPTTTAASAKATFERLKRMEGVWRGQSTRGWNEEIRMKVIAGGSAILQTSFDAHPGEAMATLFHLDGDRLMLTHYCIAKNQPRLVATAFDDEGKTVTFTFLDATNLPSRDRGHMDRVVYRFLDDDQYTSQWSWYQDGEERWLEVITATRQRDAAGR